MNARTQDRKYGGMTLEEIRGLCAENPDQDAARVVLALLDEVENSELLPRLRRIETKLHKLAVHTGAEPETTMTVSAEVVDGHQFVRLPGYDVTLAEIRRVLKAAGIDQTRAMFLMHGESLLGTLSLTNRN